LSRLTRHSKLNIYLKIHQIHKLQIGAGANILQGWLNADIEPIKDVMFLDAKKKFPFDDCTFNYIYSEHMIEHLEYQKGMHFLRECFRILKRGGRIRIATPDLSFFIKLYNSEKTALQEKYISWIVDTYLSDIGIYESVFVINNCFQNYGHKFIYDFKTLQKAMKEAGFDNIVKYDVGKSDDVNMQNIESHSQSVPDYINRAETLIFEGRKLS